MVNKYIYKGILIKISNWGLCKNIIWTTEFTINNKTYVMNYEELNKLLKLTEDKITYEITHYNN